MGLPPRQVMQLQCDTAHTFVAAPNSLRNLFSGYLHMSEDYAGLQTDMTNQVLQMCCTIRAQTRHGDKQD